MQAYLPGGRELLVEVLPAGRSDRRADGKVKRTTPIAE